MKKKKKKKKRYRAVSSCFVHFRTSHVLHSHALRSLDLSTFPCNRADLTARFPTIVRRKSEKRGRNRFAGKESDGDKRQRTQRYLTCKSDGASSISYSRPSTAAVSSAKTISGKSAIIASRVIVSYR